MAPSVPCADCKKLCEEHKILICSVCNRSFNHECIGISISEVRLIRSKSCLNWTCVDCSVLGNDLRSLKAAIVAFGSQFTGLMGEIADLKKEVADLRDKSANDVTALSDETFELVVQEVQERDARKCNLIIYGGPEDDASPSADSDLGLAKKLLGHLSITSNVAVSRLGKKLPTRTSPRPIRVILDSPQLVRQTVMQAKNLQNVAEFRDIRISTDRTPRQMQYYKKLKSEMDRRKTDGEQLRIKYIRGIPSIVSLN